MTSYQSQLKENRQIGETLLKGALVVALAVSTIMSIGFHRQLKAERASLITCTEFLSDLEASEIIE